MPGALRHRSDTAADVSPIELWLCLPNSKRRLRPRAPHIVSKWLEVSLGRGSAQARHRVQEFLLLVFLVL